MNTGEPGPTSMWFTAALVVTLSLSYFDFGRLDLPSASLDARGVSWNYCQLQWMASARCYHQFPLHL